MNGLLHLVEDYAGLVVFDSLVVALAVQVLMKLWRVVAPDARVKFYLLDLVLPAVAYPLFRLTYPDWGSQGFRDQVALVDLRQWFAFRLTDVSPFLLLLGIFMMLTALLFLTQELLPSVRHRLGRSEDARVPLNGLYPVLDQAIASLAGRSRVPLPVIAVARTAQPLAYISGLRRHNVVVSDSLVGLLSPDELEGVLAHEMGHLVQRDNRLRGLAMLLRLIMFYNPVALFAFRLVIAESEMACDGWAARVTGAPAAFAASLLKVHRAGDAFSLADGSGPWLAAHVEGWERELRYGLLRDRVERLLNGPLGGLPAEGQWARLLVTSVGLLGLLFFIV